jgi:hypothetical protein
MQNPSPATFIGEGKLEELVSKCKELEVKRESTVLSCC